MDTEERPRRKYIGRPNTFKVRMSDEELEGFRKAAEEMGMPLTDLFRHIVEQSSGKGDIVKVEGWGKAEFLEEEKS